MKNSNWLRLADAAALLRLPYRRVYDLVLSGTLPGRRCGVAWEVDASAVKRLAREREAEGAAAR